MSSSRQSTYTHIPHCLNVSRPRSSAGAAARRPRPPLVLPRSPRLHRLCSFLGPLSAPPCDVPVLHQRCRHVVPGYPLVQLLLRPAAGPGSCTTLAVAPNATTFSNACSVYLYAPACCMVHAQPSGAGSHVVLPMVNGQYTLWRPGFGLLGVSQKGLVYYIIRVTNIIRLNYII